VACIVTDGVDLAMNRYNTPRKKKEKRPRRDPAAQEDAQGTGEKTPAAQGSAPAAESEAFL